MPIYDYYHVVSFEETNLVGNVYYANHVRWQGRCREMFLYDHAPAVLADLSQGLSLATVRVSCEYYSELYALDKICIRMHLVEMVQNRITMRFEYFRIIDDREELIAKGEQQIACMQREGKKLTPTAIPAALRKALASG